LKNLFKVSIILDRSGGVGLDNKVIEHMIDIVDEHIYAEDLNALLKTFIREKKQEQSVWSEITKHTHYMLGGSFPDIDRIAAATELVILALDIMDDLQDRDQENKPWMKCPEGYTLNAILALLMGFVGELGRFQGCNSQPIVKEISKIISRSINGQQKDLNNSIVTVDDYLNMAQEKSGSLIRLACCMGYSSLDCSQETIGQIHDLADYIGLIHQIQNDIKDLTQFDLKSDLFLKKRTLPILYLLESEDESFPLIKEFYDGKIELVDFLANQEACVPYIHDSGCIEYSRVVQSICLTKAEKIYETINALSPWKEKFRELTYGSFV
jgi:competence protein ComQ